MPPTTPLRDLGNLESWFAIRHALHFHGSVTLTARYVHPTAFLTRSSLYPALQHVLSKHPVLQCTVVPPRDGCNGRFERLERLDFDEVVEFIEADEGKRGLERILEERLGVLEEGTLCWRVTVVKYPGEGEGQDVVLRYHHAAMDGESGLLFHDTLLSALSSPGSSSRPSSLPLPHPIEALTPLPISWHYTLSLLLPFLPSFLPTPRLWTGPHNFLPPKSVKTSLHILSLPISTTTSLRNACRTHNTTITATLTPIIAHALLSHLPEATTGTRSSTAISLRRFLKKEDKGMGVMSASIETSHFRSSTSDAGFWASAREIKAAIEKRCKETWDLNIAPLRFVTAARLEGMVKASVGREKRMGFGVSNLGVWSGGGQREGWTVGKAVFVQSAAVNGSALEVCVVGTEGGGMEVGFCWQEGEQGLQRGWVESVVESVRERVERIAAGKEVD